MPIDPALAEEILALRASKSKDVGDRIFESSAGAFRMGVRDACIELPEGQLTHVLRHTFASHFMMNGGNILTLQRILGHSSLQMTMRYSHLAPDHLQEARQLNPLARLHPVARNTAGIDSKLSAGQYGTLRRFVRLTRGLQPAGRQWAVFGPCSTVLIHASSTGETCPRASNEINLDDASHLLILARNRSG